MHAALVQDETECQDAVLYASVPVGVTRAAVPSADAAPYVPSAYGAQRIRWPAIAAAAAGHILVIGLLMSLEIIPAPMVPKRLPTVVNLIELPTEPPEKAPPPSEREPELVDAKQQPVVVPPPIARAPIANSVPIVVAAEPPPQRAVVVAQPGPAGPVSVADLSSTLISSKPPKYPIESRRKHEQGTVVLTVVVGASGSVAEISVARSSGFDRLDKAALAAVRGWRWSQTVRGGQPVMVKGFVDIPFVLTG